jgi:glutamyl-tRNA reductase
VNKLLHGPTARLKEAAASGDSALPGAAAELFGIDQEPPRAEDEAHAGNGTRRAAAAASERS